MRRSLVATALSLVVLAACAAPAGTERTGVSAGGRGPGEAPTRAARAAYLPVRCVEGGGPALGCGRDYFPGGYDRTEPGPVGDIIAAWHVRVLRAMGEPSLARCPAGLEAYRFLWLRSFHDPVVVRVEGRGGRARVVVKRGSRSGGAEVGEVTTAVQELPSAEWDRLARAFEAAFWAAPPTPSQEGPPGGGRIVLEVLPIDGAEWVLEGSRRGVHRVARLWSPTEGALRDLCLRMLRLGDVDADPVY